LRYDLLEGDSDSIHRVYRRPAIPVPQSKRLISAAPIFWAAELRVAIRDFTVKWIGYESVFSGLKDLGLDSFELYLDRELKGAKYSDMGQEVSLGFDMSSPQKRHELSKRLKDEGLTVCAILVENDFARPDLEAEVRWVVDACNVAPDIDCDTVRINPPMRIEEGVPEDEYVKTTIRCCQDILDRTEQTGVSLAMENHGLMGNRREFLKSVFDGLDSKRMGLTLDTGNLFWYGHPWETGYSIIQEFARRVKHVHVKNLSFPEERRNSKREPGEGWPDSAATIHEGDVDIGRIVRVLRAAEYDKDLALEDESLGKFPRDQRIGVVKQDVSFLRKLL
jgi:sugar phosphate isomerase/epimerase